MGVRGDFGKLDRFIKSLETLADDRTLTALNKNLAEEALGLIADGFKSQSDPYGAGWKPKKKPDGRAILVRSGRMRASWHVSQVTARSFTVSSSVTYAPFHQGGTRYMDARRMVPGPGRLPRRWLDPLREATKEFLLTAFKGQL